MKLEQTIEGYWLATGRGPVRRIAAEGNSRREAAFNFLIVYGEQQELCR